MLREETESQDPQLKLEKRKSTGDKQRTNSTFKKQLKTCCQCNHINNYFKYG